MRIVFMGTPDFAAVSLQRLLDERFDVVGVFTQPDKPKNRGMKLQPSPVKEIALAAGLPVFQNQSHIVPVHIGNPVHCKMISDMLLEDFGIYVQPINYPTVPKGTERLRFTPSPNHTDAMMDHLVQAMDKLFAHCNVARRPVAA